MHRASARNSLAPSKPWFRFKKPSTANDVASRRAESLLLAGSSYAARWIHREKDAKDRIVAALRILTETKDYPSESISAGSEADTAMRALADHSTEIGQPGPALEIYQELFRKIMASNPARKTTSQLCFLRMASESGLNCMFAPF